MRTTRHITTVLFVPMLMASVSHAQFSLADAIASAESMHPSLQPFEAQVETRDALVKVELADLDNFQVTEIRFDAVTGAVVETEQETPDADDRADIGFIADNLDTIAVTFDEAIMIALGSTGGGNANKIELEPRRGIVIFEVNVITDASQTQVKIDAASGEVVESSFHDLDDDRDDSGDDGDDSDDDGDDSNDDGDDSNDDGDDSNDDGDDSNDDGDDSNDDGDDSDDDGDDSNDDGDDSNDDGDDSNDDGDDSGDDNGDDGTGPMSTPLIGVTQALEMAVVEVPFGTAHDVRLRPRSRGWTFDVKLFTTAPTTFFEVRLDAVTGAVLRVGLDENEADDRAVVAALGTSETAPISLDAGIDAAVGRFPGLQYDRAKYEVEDRGLILRVEGRAGGGDVRVEMDAFTPDPTMAAAGDDQLSLRAASTTAGASIDASLVLMGAEIFSDDSDLRRAFVTTLDPTMSHLRRLEVLSDGSLADDSSWSSTLGIDGIRAIAALVPSSRVDVVGAISAVAEAASTAEIREVELRLSDDRLVYEVQSLENGAGVRYQVDAITGTVSDGSAIDSTGCVADFDRDGDADAGDLLTMLSFWFEGSLDADMNDDGDISVSDLLVFLDAYLGGCA